MAMEVTRTLRGELSDEEVFATIDEALKEHMNLKPRGIRVSNSLHQRGIAREYRGIPIAMDPDLYPDDQVQIVFDDE